MNRKYKILAIGMTAVLVFSLSGTAFAKSTDATTDTVGTVTVDPPKQSITGGSQTNNKTDEEIHDENVNSNIEDGFDKLFPNGTDVDAIKSWINSQKDSVLSANKVAVDKTFLQAYLNYLKSLSAKMKSQALITDAVAKKTPPKYMLGDTQTYEGAQRTPVSGSTDAEGLGVTFDMAALQALIDALQAMGEGGFGGKLPSISLGYGGNLFEQLGITQPDLNAMLQAGIDAGLIRDDFGYNGMVLPSTIDELNKLLQQYLDKLNSGGKDKLVLYKITEYTVDSYTHKHIIKKNPTGNYLWDVTPGDNVSKTTDTNSLRIIFKGSGDYSISVKSICDVTDGDIISGKKLNYWVIGSDDGYNGIVIRATSKEFSATVKRGEVRPDIPLQLRNVIRNVSEAETNTVAIVDMNGNIITSAKDFTTQRYS